MPRITISRVLGLVPLAWVCLVGTWFFLPSPEFPDFVRDDYIQYHLRVGHTVTTIAEFDSSFTSNSRSLRQNCGGGGGCPGLVFDWQLESHPATDSLLLHVGKARVNLTDAVLQGPQVSEATQEQKPYLGPTFSARLRTGSPNHNTILPWFRWTDKILIYWTMHHSDENVDLRVFSPQPGVVEIWKDIEMWKDYQPGDPVRDTERAVGLLASFSHLQVAQFSGGAALRANSASVSVSKVQGQLPSKTWPTRAIIAGPLYIPTFLITVLIRRLTFQMVPLTVILIFQLMCVLLIFLRFERFNLSPGRWCCSERSKRSKQRGVWGAAGPISDEENGLLSIRPQKPMAMFPHAISKPSRSRAPVFDKV